MMMKRTFPIVGICAAVVFQSLETAAADQVAPPSAETAAAFRLATNYTKCLLVEGLPVLGSARVSDHGVLEAAYLIRKEIGHRPEVLRAMAGNRVRFVVMAPTEMTTDVPEHGDLTPKSYWNRRARGLGATEARPAVSCGEENLLCIRGDPYAQENILLHEFAHAIHERGMNAIDPTFDRRLKEVYAHAKSNGLWKGTYAMQNRMEYWAEGAQSWFDCNRANDNEHGPVDTREKLKAYDPDFAALLAEVFGDFPWRYQRPAARPESERGHLAGLDVTEFPPFRWPASAPELASVGEKLPYLAPEQIPSASPRRPGKPTSILFVNKRAEAVSIAWINFEGKRQHMSDVRPRLQHLQDTYAGHVFVVTDQGRDLGTVAAAEAAGRVEIE